MVDLRTGDGSVLASCFHPALHRTPSGWAWERNRGVGPGHLLQEGDEHADMELNVGMSQKTGKSSYALGFGEKLRPWGKKTGEMIRMRRKRMESTYIAHRH